MCLNPFIIECHEQFKSFFKYCCEIEELESHFLIHEFTETTLIHKPEICISLQEICDTHCLVLEYQDQIAPDPLDSLHELLEDLGTIPTVSSLLGLGRDKIILLKNFIDDLKYFLQIEKSFEKKKHNLSSKIT